MARKTKQEAQETRQHILDVALRLFSQQGVSSTSLGEIAKAAGVTRGAIYWHFKDKSDLFSEIWELSESNIGELELEYQAKFGNDSNLLIVFYVQIMPDDFVMQLHR
ncbi:TetR family transcriptional regulator, partial [Escherichia coli]